MATGNSKGSGLPVLPNDHQPEANEDLSQESQDLIASLFATPFCQYQGFWYPKRILQGILNCQNHLQAHDSDILLVTSPKSGTTWLKALVFAITNRKTHYPSPIPDANKIGNPHPLLTTNPHDLVPFLEVQLYLTENLPDLSSFPAPRIFASHLPYVSLPECTKQSGCKIVYLCRNPKDLFVSLWHFKNRLIPKNQGTSDSIEDSFQDFCRGTFWDHVLGYYQENLERSGKVMFLRFEDLKNEPVETLKDLANFIGYGFSEEEENGDVVGDIWKLCSFENLSTLKVNKNGNSWSGIKNELYFRRGEVGDWKNLLTTDMVKRLDAITYEKLQKYGLKF